MFKTNKIILGILLCLLAVQAGAAQEPKINGYKGDMPLTTYSHDILRGGLSYTVGDSLYSGKIWAGDAYTVHHTVSLPDGAVVKFARLYNYWTWSAKGTTGRYPEMNLTFDGNEISPEAKYDDRKGWGDVYDYPTGTWAYNVTSYVNAGGSHTTVIKNSGPPDSFFCMDGVGLLVVYTYAGGKDIEYWVNEGADMLNSQMNEDGTPKYYATPDQTITEMMNPVIQGEVKSAKLWTIVQSGGWDANKLWINDMNWTGISDGTPYPDLDVDERDITKYLKPGKNIIRFQAVGDYAVPSGSFLVVEKEQTAVAQQTAKAASAASASSQRDTEAEAQAQKNTPGFEAAPSIALVVITAFLTFRRCSRKTR